MSKLDRCPLCGNEQTLDENTVCNVCGTKEEKWLFIPLGRIYEAEATEAKSLFKWALTLVAVMIAAFIFSWIYFQV